MTTTAESRETDDTDSSSNADQGHDYHQVESLVAGRAKRSTAGNRLASLREGDDELELLFAEDDGEEDVEFGDDDTDGPSDVSLDSSSDEEDNDSGKVDDELEGERELQKQSRTELQKKRKAHDVFKRPGGSRKKMLIQPITNTASPRTPAVRARKKSERVSWIPTPEDGPTRSSTRKQTVQNKHSVHQRMVESEKRRVQLIHVMEEAAKRKEAAKPKLLTQAERMEEAARTEERNARSLNRWEETEKKRSDEQKAKLAALQNRHLSGPVITWWSGMASWMNGRLIRVGCRGAKEASRDGVVDAGGTVSKNTVDKPGHDDMSITGDNVSPSRSTTSQRANRSQPQPIPTLPAVAGPGSNGLADDTRSHSSVRGESQQLNLINRGRLSDSRADIPSNPRDPEAPPCRRSSNPASTRHPEASSDVPANVIEHSSRNLVILDNIDGNDMRLPALQNHPLLKKRNGKPPRTCASSPPLFAAADSSCHVRAGAGAVRDHRATR